MPSGAIRGALELTIPQTVSTLAPPGLRASFPKWALDLTLLSIALLTTLQFADLSHCKEPSRRSLSHAVPRGVDIYRDEETTIYPFPTIWTSGTWVSGLYSCLQPSAEISAILDAYAARTESFVWPHLASEITKKEVERFLADFENNATSYPDMLALIFAALATGVQRGMYDRGGQQWAPGIVQRENLRGDLFSTFCKPDSGFDLADL